MTFIFISSPFNHADPNVRRERYDEVLRFMAYLVDGRSVDVHFSPILCYYALAEKAQLPMHWEYWKDINKWYVRHADEIYVLCSSGWKKSKGVAIELEWAQDMDIPVTYYYPATGDLPFSSYAVPKD